MTHKVYVTVEVFHLEFEDHFAEMELECEVTGHVEGEDPSVGIFGNSYVVEEIEVTGVLLYDTVPARQIPIDLAKFLVPEDVWNYLMQEATEQAEKDMREEEHY